MISFIVKTMQNAHLALFKHPSPSSQDVLNPIRARRPNEWAKIRQNGVSHCQKDKAEFLWQKQ